MTADQKKNTSALPVTPAPETSAYLTPYQQQVVELRNQGLPFRAISERLGRNVSNVHRTHKRALANLEREATAVDSEKLLAKWNKDIAARGPVTDKSLLADVEEIIGLLIFFLRENTVALARTSPKDHVATLVKLVEKRQLLKGEPTAITRLEDVRKVDEALEALYAEAERRGLKPGSESVGKLTLGRPKTCYPLGKKLL